MNNEISNFLKTSALLTFSGTLMLGGCSQPESVVRKPNFIILMSDNHSPEHLGCYGDKIVKTPIIDKIASEGIRFTNAFCSAPSSSPARASMLTGQDMWRLEEAANLWGKFPSKFQVFTDLLEKSGYLVGIEGKGWGPGDYIAGGFKLNPGGDQFNSFEEFLNVRKRGQPFCYWFSSRSPHRPFILNGGKEAGIDLTLIKVPTYLPDNNDVRGDIADYYAEIQNFDGEVGAFIQLLKEIGLMKNTLVVVCSDNGWQMPRGLANLYDFGTKIPMIFSMPERFKVGRVVDDFVSLNDLAPTFLDLAGIPVPKDMTAKSLGNILKSEKNGIIEPERDFIVTARERHAFVRKGGEGYGARAIRTKDFLYIRNYDPERWPAGDPPLFGDVDAHMLQYPCPTKTYMLKNRDKEDVKDLFVLAFEKRPAEELYDLNMDPEQMKNIVENKDYLEVKNKLSERLIEYLKNTNDPRVTGGEMKWINAEYFATKDLTPTPSKSAQEELGLDEKYSYVK